MLNKEPKIEYFSKKTTNWTNVNGTIIDTAKVHNQNNNANYVISLRSKDNNNNFEYIDISTEQDGGEFFLNDERFINQKRVKIDSFSLAYRYYKSDIRKFTISSTDDFGKQKNINFQITFIDNIKPTAKFEIRKESDEGIIQHTIDAEFSIDGDQKYGGYITNYEFNIDGVIINSSLPYLKHVFSIGNHQISLRVQDNDHQWSEQYSKSILIK
ncbi:MAG TPA: hypothetical protein DDY16_08905 [Tenacibaculum sp.]|nr:hypothetical protein [Tenacibaculum sp.]HBI41051.1 hypothetical protein [Tenacibaculum sp.]